MMNVRKPVRPLVEVPSAAEDRPAWVKIGVIAMAGFAIGVVWPRLAGVHLGPSAPTDSAPSSAQAPPAPHVEAQASAVAQAPAPASATPPAPSASAAPAPEIPNVTVNRGVVLTCRTEEGEMKKGVSGCGGVPGFDGVAQPRLRKLAACPAALGASGKLSVVFNIDFPSNKVALEVGKSSTVGNLDGFAACIRPAFQGVSLGPLDHQNPKYSLLYSLAFTPKDAKVASNVSSVSTPAAATLSPASAPPASPQGGASPVEPTDDTTAQVVWEVAIVRDTPRTGQVLARLQRGTKIRLGAGQDGWYRVKYGDGFGSEGWVYRGAIGR
jgi:hypothetical protein